MRPALFISWRYLISGRKEKFISLISIVSILGIAIGVMALMVVIAVMTGFDEDLRDKIIGNYAHITVFGYSGIDLDKYKPIEKKILSNPHILGISPYLQGQVFVQNGENFFAVGLKGIIPQTEINVSKLNRYLRQGKLEDLDPQGLIIGKELAARLDLKLGSYLGVYSPSGGSKNLRIVGIFNSGMYDYDAHLIFVHLKTAEEILGLENKISAIAIKLDNLYLADKVKEELSNLLGFDYVLKTWMEANQNFFAALKLEKFTMFVILVLIILVASFNIISTLSVMVVEKTKDIGILKAIGMDAGGIRKVFTYEGLFIGGLGTFLGFLGGVILCYLLKKYQFIKLPADIYYIDRLPVSIQFWPDVILIILSAMLITLVSTLYPSLKAALLKPIEALRYE